MHTDFETRLIPPATAPGLLTASPNRKRVLKCVSDGVRGGYLRQRQCAENWGRATFSPGNQQPGQWLLKAKTPKLRLSQPGYHRVTQGFLSLEAQTAPQPCVLPSVSLPLRI